MVGNAGDFFLGSSAGAYVRPDRGAKPKWAASLPTIRFREFAFVNPACQSGVGRFHKRQHMTQQKTLIGGEVDSLNIQSSGMVVALFRRNWFAGAGFSNDIHHGRGGYGFRLSFSGDGRFVDDDGHGRVSRKGCCVATVSA